MALSGRIRHWERCQTSAFERPQQFAGMGGAKVVDISAKTLARKELSTFPVIVPWQRQYIDEFPARFLTTAPITKIGSNYCMARCQSTFARNLDRFLGPVDYGFENFI